MAQTDAKTIKSQLKKGELSNLYYLFGADVNGTESLTKAIIKSAVGDNEDFSLTKLRGNSLDISQLRDTIEMMPMMSEYNCILINDYNCEEHKEEEIKQLFDALKEIPPQTIVIFNVTGFEVKVKVNIRKNQRTVNDKNKKLTDFAIKNGVLCEQPLKTSSELAKEICAKVSSRGGMISVKNAQTLAEMCLSDILMINNEIDKLCAYADGREITEQMLEELVPRQSDLTVYNFANAVVAFNRKSAYDMLDDLLERFPKSQDRRMLLSVISGAFTDLYRASCARKAGKGINDVMQDFGYHLEFVVRNAFRDSSRIPTERLRKCITILSEATEKLNSTSADEKIVLEETLTKMLMK